MRTTTHFKAGLNHKKMAPGRVLVSVTLLSVALLGVVALVSCKNPGSEGESKSDSRAPGFYTEGAQAPVAGITTFDEALTWLTSNAENDGQYTLYLAADESSPPRHLNPDTLNSASGVEITLCGSSGERVMTLSEDGNLFTVKENTKLILGENITLHGKDDNNASLILVKVGGVLEMGPGSKVINNKNTSTNATSGADLSGGIYIYGGSFIMNGGEISGNGGFSGGGVRLNTAQSFTMTDGIIQNNHVEAVGGGIYMQDWFGGGTISGGSIINNTAAEGGGGITASINGTLTLSDSVIISGNAANDTSADDVGGGGGIKLFAGTIVFSGGTLANNTALAAGTAAGSHNLYVKGGTFTNSSGTPIVDSVPAH